METGDRKSSPRPSLSPEAVRTLCALLAAVLIGLGVALIFYSPRRPAAKRPRPAAAAVPPVGAAAAPAKVDARESKTERDLPSALAADLGSPRTTIQRDLEILNDVFLAWQSNFPHAGNPVGDNAEITAALTGRNPLHFEFIRHDHPAIDARGELCDRWGTPFFFHALAGTRMEIRSAGPDRQLYTADDIVFTP